MSSVVTNNKRYLVKSAQLHRLRLSFSLQKVLPNLIRNAYWKLGSKHLRRFKGRVAGVLLPNTPPYFTQNVLCVFELTTQNKDEFAAAPRSAGNATIGHVKPAIWKWRSHSNPAPLLRFTKSALWLKHWICQRFWLDEVSCLKYCKQTFLRGGDGKTDVNECHSRFENNR